MDSTTLTNPITIEDVRAAQSAIADTAIQTPAIVTDALSAATGATVRLKLESLQPTGAFKIRGATYALSKLPAADRDRGVICCSTGNHGRALSYAAKRLGIPATVCVSAPVPEVKVRAIAELGATVHRAGATQDAAQLEADRLTAETDATQISPFDHPDVIAGQGTIGLELMAQHPDIDTIITPLSGGGLAGGIALAAKAVNPNVRVIGVSMARGPAMAESMRAGHPVAVTESPTLADALAGGIGESNQWTLRLCTELIDEVALVSESEIRMAMHELFHRERLVTEGSAAVGAAAILAGKVRCGAHTAVIVTGRNVDMELFTDIVTGRPVRLGDETLPALDQPCG